MTLSGPLDALNARIDARRSTVGICGMGYVGLPLAMAAYDAGFPVLAFDTDPAKIAKLNVGEPYLRHIAPAKLATMARDPRFSASGDPASLAGCDVIVICVPTPLGAHREPDLSYVERTAETIATHLRPGQLVALESTTYPGTTRDVVLPILKGGGLRHGVDFLLAYSPEREDPGNASFTTRQMPKVVGGLDAAALAAAERFYSALVDRVVPVASAEVAEAVKITENVFRAVNIALVNELKVIYDALGIDVWDVIEAAKTKPFGYMPFYPGPGLGGHCIPIDPFYLTWKAREAGIQTRFVELAGEVNAAMPAHVVERAAQALDRASGKGLSAARVLLIGMAYKPNVDDMRESPALEIAERLIARGAEVAFHDPWVPVIPPTREHMALAGRVSVALTAAELASRDLVLVVTDHADIDWALIAAEARLVVDTRNALDRRGLATANLVKA